MKTDPQRLYILDVQSGSHQKEFAISVSKYSIFLPGKERSIITKPTPATLLYTFPLHLTCKGLRYTGLLWLSKEKGNNLPKIDPEPTIIFAAKKRARKRYISIIKALRVSGTQFMKSSN